MNTVHQSTLIVMILAIIAMPYVAASNALANQPRYIPFIPSNLILNGSFIIKPATATMTTTASVSPKKLPLVNVSNAAATSYSYFNRFTTPISESFNNGYNSVFNYLKSQITSSMPTFQKLHQEILSTMVVGLSLLVAFFLYIGKTSCCLQMICRGCCNVFRLGYYVVYCCFTIFSRCGNGKTKDNTTNAINKQQEQQEQHEFENSTTASPYMSNTIETTAATDVTVGQEPMNNLSLFNKMFPAKVAKDDAPLIDVQTTSALLQNNFSTPSTGAAGTKRYRRFRDKSVGRRRVKFQTNDNKQDNEDENNTSVVVKLAEKISEISDETAELAKRLVQATKATIEQVVASISDASAASQRDADADALGNDAPEQEQDEQDEDDAISSPPSKSVIKRPPSTGSEGLLYRPASTGSGSNNDDPIELIDSDEDDTKEDLATQKIDSSDDEDDDSIAM